MQGACQSLPVLTNAWYLGLVWVRLAVEMVEAAQLLRKTAELGVQRLRTAMDPLRLDDTHKAAFSQLPLGMEAVLR